MALAAAGVVKLLLLLAAVDDGGLIGVTSGGNKRRAALSFDILINKSASGSSTSMSSLSRPGVAMAADRRCGASLECASTDKNTPSIVRVAALLLLLLFGVVVVDDATCGVR